MIIYDYGVICFLSDVREITAKSVIARFGLGKGIRLELVTKIFQPETIHRRVVIAHCVVQEGVCNRRHRRPLTVSDHVQARFRWNTHIVQYPEYPVTVIE